MKILNIQRMSTEDGPGIRTTVFFKGCPLSCKWCHNPESINPNFQKEWFSVRCIGCKTCIDHCKNKALKMTNAGIVTDMKRCTLCLECTEICPTGAMAPIGKNIEVDRLVKEVIKDKAYFNGDGGVTLSGGEVLSQVSEVKTLCEQLKKANLSVAIDTSGFAPYPAIESLLPSIDLILYDMKFVDPIAHAKYCGVDNELIKTNLKRLSEESDVTIWVRTPIIPQATDTVENIHAIALFLTNNHIRYDRWELCAFNNLCKDKYTRLNQVWDYEKAPLITKEKMRTLTEEARQVTGKTNQISATGLTLLEEDSHE